MLVFNRFEIDFVTQWLVWYMVNILTSIHLESRKDSSRRIIFNVLQITPTGRADSSQSMLL